MLAALMTSEVVPSGMLSERERQAIFHAWSIRYSSSSTASRVRRGRSSFASSTVKQMALKAASPWR
eukprot:5917159-Alexandrium_andersonii.AAC.1